MQGVREAFLQTVGDSIRCQELETVLQRCGVDEASAAYLLRQAHGVAAGEVLTLNQFLASIFPAAPPRSLSYAHGVAEAGSIDAWNEKHSDVKQLALMLKGMCKATSVEEALAEVSALMSLEHNLWTYAYMRKLYDRSPNLYYATISSKPSMLLPAVYTPTVGEACQKFGKMPLYSRGCYLRISERGRFKEVLREYAEAELEKDPAGEASFLCDCIVFSDGGRILGLGDLGAWGMGIPIGKLDLYTVCAGFNPKRTIPLIIDAGCSGAEGKTDKLTVRDSELYTGMKVERQTRKSAAGTVVNSAYYGEGNVIREFMQAATELFGRHCLLQFEDFNSNDAFPLLAQYRDQFLCYNDDIQGTAAVALAALLGAMKLRNPYSDPKETLLKEKFLFHGAGSANIGLMRLLHYEAGVPLSSIFVTNSRGLIWRSSDGCVGSFRNAEQKEFAQVGEPTFNSKDLVTLVEQVQPTCVVGAVGVAPNCFTKPMIQALTKVTARPVVFALSNPKSQAEITAENCYQWSEGKAIFGSGTWFAPVECNGKRFAPGQVNNVYIFPGMSFGAVCCQAKSIPERLFLVAAEAVALSLGEEEHGLDMVVPKRDRIQEVSLNVATAVAMEAQKLGLAGRHLGEGWDGVRAALEKKRWLPQL
ncbi:NADP-dependent malic enzyme (NADP-ME) [Durusdinium trenchii]|uniref:NADP-dependent malic enzyme (NADP-ME) n=1 Tax=Durusdinium trenchii TaxID=1381693 RepID=A0ABP0PXF0_9DINO